MTHCYLCGVSCFNATLYRTVPLGQSCPNWACEKCLPKESPPIDRTVREVSELIRNPSLLNEELYSD